MQPTPLHPDVQKLLFSEAQLQERIRQLGAQISQDYAGKNPLLVCVLKGAVHFFTELAKTVTTDCAYDFVSASSYADGTESSGKVRLLKDIETNIKDRDVLIVDDIIDTGLTLQYLAQVFKDRAPCSVRTCVLLDKPERRTTDFSADYVGFTVPNFFVVGYGLDYQQRYRNLPYIGVLKPEKYSNLPLE